MGGRTMKQSTAKILNENRGALDVTAAAARISTQEGTAREIYARSGDREKDLKLVGKVLSSGHQSVVEHQTFSIAFNDVSVLAEQFIIEFRLASFTVKSRRYVDFSKAGYVADDGLSGEAARLYAGRAEALFGDYERLLALGVPKEDARFLLPYCLRSNFFATMNARELVRMIQAMRFGRGARFAELRGLGEQLSAQLDALYPGVFSFGPMDEAVAPTAQPLTFAKGEPAKGGAELLAAPGAAEKLLAAAMDFSGRWPQGYSAESVRALIRDSRPRELEVLNYTFRVSDVSLACVTHFTRHRMQSLMVPDVIRALINGRYVLPESVAASPEAKAIYCEAFAAQADAANRLAALGAPAATLSYLAMSGHVLDLMLTMNARELLLFSRLRTCTRAQWEIRGVARQMVAALSRTSPEIFGGYGPSCAVMGRCPEGRMSCGHPVSAENGVWKER